MRYRKWSNRLGRVRFVLAKKNTPSVSDQLVEALRERFSGSKATYRLAGHSLGCQLVIHASSKLAKLAVEDKEIRLPNRIALLDPFFTHGNKVRRRTEKHSDMWCSACWGTLID